jgi:hypothetical protein
MDQQSNDMRRELDGRVVVVGGEVAVDANVVATIRARPSDVSVTHGQAVKKFILVALHCDR